MWMEACERLDIRDVATVGLSLIAWAAGAQVPAAGDFDSVVSNYVAEGLRSNLALQGESSEVGKGSAKLWPKRVPDFSAAVVRSSLHARRRWTRNRSADRHGVESCLFDT